MAKAEATRRRNREAAPRAANEVAAKPSDLVSSKVLKLANVLRRASTLVYGRKLALSQVEWRIVALVGEHAPVSLNALADLLDLDKGQTSRSVSALVARRLMLREYRRDGRGIRITLTARGIEVYRELMASALERNRVLLGGMTAEEKTQLFEILDRLTGLARTILAEEQGR
ncbi:MAG TPA: winged helix DNA-binding protein [Xanthobacteraceae bacterium]|nr:winged helix DNA-binding protein [Xanthobacteraceae bacterium]